MFASSAVQRGCEPRSGQIKDNEIGIYCFSTKHAALRSKNKNGWLFNAKLDIYSYIMARNKMHFDEIMLMMISAWY
jgi:hypothetical protein